MRFLSAEIPQGSVIITPTEMYAEIRATRDEVRHLTAVVDPSLTEIRADVGENSRRLADHDLRLRALESRPVVTPKSMWGGVGVLTAAAALIVTIIIALIT